jgi:hypothetical protein
VTDTNSTASTRTPAVIAAPHEALYRAPELDHSFGLAETPPKPENQVPLKRHERPAVMMLRVDDGLEPDFARYPLTPFSRVTPAYQRPLRLIVRACVA